MSENKQITQFKNANEIKKFLAANYLTQIKNFFGDEKQALKFLSSVMASIQNTPGLIDCKPMTLINSFLTMAQLGLMPSGVSGEAYVLPYNKGDMGKIAQFQLGYQGLITLFYRAGGTGIRADIIREHDKYSLVNGVLQHEIDITKTNEQRGKPIAAYAVAKVNGEEISKVMNATDILAYGENFSKSFKSKFTPWDEKNDPELWMWKKTVLKQLAKLLPKNETINRAVSYDNQDSRISEVKGMVEENSLQMGKFQLKDDNESGQDTKIKKGEEDESDIISPADNPFNQRGEEKGKK